MKKALSILAAAMLVPLLSSPAWADDDAAYSANAVGVVKYTIPGNAALTCVAFPLNSFEDDSQWVWTNNSFSAQLPNSTTVYFWDGTVWQSSTKGKRGWDGAGLTKILSPGEAFFVKGLSASTNVSLLGELPTDLTSTYKVRGGGNLDTRAVTVYPVEVVFTNSSLASNLVNGSTVYFWDGAVWQSSTKGKRGWDGYGMSYTVGVGEGVFIKSGTAEEADVEIARPFDWN